MSQVALTSQFSPEMQQAGDLAQRIARGDRGAFDELLRLYQQRVARLAQRLLGYGGDVEDVVQEVFITALRKAGSFKGNCSLWTWLKIITINRCRSHHRHQRVVERTLGWLGRRRSGHAAPADDATLGDETSQQVRVAVARLRQPLREVVVLFYLEHQSIEQIAELLGASTGAVEARLHRARVALRQSLKSLYGA